MVSTSRKKNKGKDRKAKKEADRVEAERVRARNVWFKWVTGHKDLVGKTITCKHVMGENILSMSDDHPVVRFMDILFSGSAKNITSVIDSYPQVWNEDRYREMTVRSLIRVGTNMLFSEDANVTGASTLARVIMLLEQYDGPDSVVAVMNSRRVQMKVRDLRIGTSSISRDALKFYSKRVSCSCLKSKHQKARRTIPKTGRCLNCNEEMERVALSVCGRCMVMQYCSKECQVFHWPKHKDDCDIYS